MWATPDELECVTLRHSRALPMVVLLSTSGRVGDLSSRSDHHACGLGRKLPAVHSNLFFAAAGGLISSWA